MHLRKATDIALGSVSTLAVVAAALTCIVIAQEHPKSNPNAIAEQFDLTIVWYDDGSPCGDVADWAGCYQHSNPDVIYVAVGLDPEKLNSVVLHEIGHAMQDRLGLPGDECAADEFAESMGATYLPYDC